MYRSLSLPLGNSRLTSDLRALLSQSLITLSLGLIALLLFSLGLRLTLLASNLYLNVSDSLPAGLYASEADTRNLRKNELVLACLPDAASSLGLSRGYLTAQGLLNRCHPVGKYVVATAGDYVRVDLEGIRVNDRLLPHTAPLPYDGRGRRLQPARLDTSLKEHELLLAGFLPHSYDSRYFGVLREEQIIGRLKPVFTF